MTFPMKTHLLNYLLGFPPSRALGPCYCQPVERRALVSFAILPYDYPTRSCVSTRSSLCPTAALMYPLAQYVDLIALLAYLLDPPGPFLRTFDQAPNNASKKKMLTEFSIRAVRDVFSTTCTGRSQALISIIDYSGLASSL